MSRLFRGRLWVAASCVALFDFTRHQLLYGSKLAGFMSADSAAPSDTTMDSRGNAAAVPIEHVQYRILVAGKTGNGKSTLCNNILGKDAFATARSMAMETKRAQHSHGARNGIQLKVVDTPDWFNMEGNEMSLEEEIKRWKELTSPSPSAIVLTVRCDVRYTAEEYDIYRQMKKTWGDKAFTRRLVVAFTFGDRQDRDISEELQSVNEELKSVIRDAKGRYVVFSNKADDTEKQVQVQKLLDIVSSMEMMKEDEDGPDYLLRIEIALFVAAVASGICLAAFITKKMHQETAVFAVMCAGFTAALVGTEVYRRLKK